jgi:ribosomal protein S12 methylthiotransferase
VTKERSKGTCALVMLGCPKNLVDSERMLGVLQRDGYRIVFQPEEADFVVVNTCGFIERARQESFDTIEEMIGLKREGRIRGVIVAGCLAEREKTALLDKYPEIDQIVGVFAREEIAGSARRLLELASPDEVNGRQRATFRPAPDYALDDTGRFRITVPHSAFLKIAEGCDRLCTFCSIPSMRGKYVSKPIEQVVAEAEELAADGTRELILIAQDTSYYGRDLYGQSRLAPLLRRLEEVDGLEWIRLMYLYPMHVGEELIDVLAAGRKVVPYLDMPLQHINDEVLRRMNRMVTRAGTERLLERLRQRIEGLVLRTTLIAGFPGETDAQFEELIEFARRWRFERLGVFPYYREPGTPSADLDGQLPDAVKQARANRLMEVQQPIAFAWNEAQVGRRMDVLIDRDIPGQRHAYVGRSYADAPEVDGVVYVTGEGLAAGRIVPCEIVGSREYDLIGVAVGQPR